MNTAVSPPRDSIPHLQRLTTDFPYFARQCLYIRTKSGELTPFVLNRSQRYIHERLERQRVTKGKVRALIVKSRQQGSSTYIEGRFLWRMWRSTKALKCFILTHHDDATSNLFTMTQRFYDNLPLAIKPPTKAANAKELIFADSGCAFSVSTAGGREIGRSDTIQLFHGSEVPSWPNADQHMVSLGPALSNAPGTEWILESTAKGIGNVFYNEAMAAIAGASDYEAIFTPWFWSDEYAEPCPKSFADEVSDEWLEYGHMHKLEWPQLYWAWKENARIGRAKSLSPDVICPDFRQEYPTDIMEAFQSSGDSFIPAIAVLRARKRDEKIIGRGPIILGIDPARDRDYVGIIDRCGRRAGERICETWPPQGDTVFLAQRIASVIKKLQPDAVNIDVGHNPGLYDILRDMGYGHMCNPVNFGSAPIGLGPTGDRMYAHRRDEMWDEMRDWFEEPGGVQIPDDDNLHKDLTAPIWGPGETRYTSNNALQLESKDKIKERIGRSPDLGDALALTFAVPFAGTMMSNNVSRPKRKVGRGGY